ncbi:MAG TPA: 30S ribosome-binding factor RbfA [Bacteroidales bacterium]|nr:30S ribosome-binding factor RbfA [Bacteroidales bacterium]HOS57074.1 30S ribosome-binding factor RbfA [Bacteroidales bacterium]HRR03670.1 30S ribosome-binding factor RbfA [Bacteroidales bacterium]HRT13861.1 30S ribosome-binding factor RbfA [Bacteroidales bacterium]HXK74307.1 30S ribosome-binding factor RbfA [Bacteroidales bacterium]
METTRQQKIAKLIQKELADILIQKELNVYNAMLTVMKVSVTRDFSIARVYISVFNTTDKQQVIKAIRSNSREIRYELGQRVKNQLRIIPELEFYIDDSLDYIENIENLLKS